MSFDTVPEINPPRWRIERHCAFSDAAKISDVLLSWFALDADIFNKNCLPIYVIFPARVALPPFDRAPFS